MTPTQQRRIDAKLYIDRMLELNRRHGASNAVPEAAYRAAIDRAASVFAKAEPAK